MSVLSIGKQDRVARFAMWSAVAFALLALGAPLIASSRPFWMFVPQGEGGTGFLAMQEGWSFPWFAALFDARLYETLLDRQFNGLLVVLPIVLLARLVANSRVRRSVTVGGVLVGLALPFVVHTSSPPRDYASRIEAMRARGVDVVAALPLVPHAPAETEAETGLAGPSRSHWFGTDTIGRDVLSMLLFGARTALSVGLLSVLLSHAIGILIGMIAGARGGLVDLVLGRLIEVVACIPFFVLVVALIAILGEHSLWHVVLIFGLFGWTGSARLVRAEMLRLREQDSTLAARALGIPEWRIAFFHLLPAALTPLIVSAGFAVASTILVEASLSFLGLSDPTLPSWGQVLRAGRETHATHLILAPGILIFYIVTAINLLADALRESMQVKPSTV